MRPQDDPRPGSTRRAARRLAAVTAALALLAAACGGGGDGDGEAAPSTTAAGPAASPGSTTTAEPSGDDQALADAALLRASDLPAGFVASAGGEDGAKEEAGDPFGPCAEKSSTLSSAVTASAQGPQLSSDTLSASGGAMVFRSVAAAEEAMEALESDEVTDCVSESFSAMATLGDEAVEDTMSMAFTSAFAPDVGDDATAYHLEISFPAIFEEEESGDGMTLTAEIVFARQGRVVGMYGFAGLGDTLPEPDREAALAKALARAASAQA